MSSVSSTSSSLGNTALRGFGGLASGIDRDALIENDDSRNNIQDHSQETGYDQTGMEAGCISFYQQ